MKVLISSYHMNMALRKYRHIFQKNNIIISRIIQNPSVKEANLKKIIHKFDGVICSDDELTGEVLLKAKKLKVISKWGTGIDSIDLKIAKKMGIKIFNTPGAFTTGVAQHAIGMMFNLTRKISLNDKSLKNGHWDKFEGINIEGKKIGIIGLGKIGMQIIKYLKNFNVFFYGYDIDKKKKLKFKKKYKIFSLDQIFKSCDIIFICVNLNKTSYHLVKMKQLKFLKSKNILINISRGPVVDNAALVSAIMKRKFKIGFDVFENEPIEKKVLKILNKRDNILTSHNAFNTKEEVDFVHLNTINNLIKGLKS